MPWWGARDRESATGFFSRRRTANMRWPRLQGVSVACAPGTPVADEVVRPEIGVGGGDNALWPLSYTDPKSMTGFEPATSPLGVEVTPACAPGRRSRYRTWGTPRHWIIRPPGAR